MWLMPDGAGALTKNVDFQQMPFICVVTWPGFVASQSLRRWMQRKSRTAVEDVLT